MQATNRLLRLTKQQRQVLEWLLTGAKVTQQDAFGRGIERLGARVWDLRRAGVAVKSEMITVIKKTTNAQAKVSCYWLEGPERCRVREILAGKTTNCLDGRQGLAADPAAAPTASGSKMLIPDADKPIGRYR